MTRPLQATGPCGRFRPFATFALCNRDPDAFRVWR